MSSDSFDLVKQRLAQVKRQLKESEQKVKESEQKVKALHLLLNDTAKMLGESSSSRYTPFADVTRGATPKHLEQYFEYLSPESRDDNLVQQAIKFLQDTEDDDDAYLKVIDKRCGIVDGDAVILGEQRLSLDEFVAVRDHNVSIIKYTDKVRVGGYVITFSEWHAAKQALEGINEKPR